MYATLALSVITIIGLFIYLQSSNRTISTPLPPAQQKQKEVAQHITEITLTEKGFSPSIITVKRGTTISWANKSGETATINSSDHPTHKKFVFLNLGEFEPNFSVQTQIMDEGTFTYHNDYKPEQTGIIIVK